MNRIDSNKLQSYVPRYITQEQAEQIKETPQQEAITAKQQELS